MRNHLAQTWAIDLLTIISVRFRILYAVVVLSLERRAIVHVAVTEHPTAEWVAQHLVEAVADVETPPRFLIHDRDNIFGESFRRRVDHLGVRRLVTPPRSPRANTSCERVIQTLRRDCLDHIIVWNERHAERVLREYVPYYHRRPHRGLRMQPPLGAHWLAPPRGTRCNDIDSRTVLGGLHRAYGFRRSASPRSPPG